MTKPKKKRPQHRQKPQLSVHDRILREFADILETPEYEQLTIKDNFMSWVDPDTRMLVDCLITESWLSGEDNNIELWYILGTLDFYGFTFDTDVVVDYIHEMKHRAIHRDREA